jgi:hypothetical protein
MFPPRTTFAPQPHDASVTIPPDPHKTHHLLIHPILTASVTRPQKPPSAMLYCGFMTPRPIARHHHHHHATARRAVS